MKKQLIILLFSLISSSLSSFGQCLMGEVRMFAGNFAPRSWAYCDGQLLPVSTYTALFSILGTTYGGDGRVTFALPDLRGRTPVHPGNGPGLNPVSRGQKGGNEYVNLTINNLPAHQHTGYIKVSDAEGDIYHSNNNYFADRSKVENNQFSDVTANGHKRINGVETNVTGNGQAYYKRSPFTGISYIICIEGIFPSRP